MREERQLSDDGLVITFLNSSKSSVDSGITVVEESMTPHALGVVVKLVGRSSVSKESESTSSSIDRV